MASVTVNGSLALDFASSEEKSRDDSPISATGYDDSNLNESPYQELSGDDDYRNAIQESQLKLGNDILMAEPIRPPVAKKRRKQSNPVRFAAMRLMDMKTTDRDADEGPLDLAADLVDGRPSPEQLYRCSHCNALFDVDEDLRLHIEEEHVQKVLERQLHHHNMTKAHAKEAAAMVEKDEPPDLTLPYQGIHDLKDGLKMGIIPSTMPQLTPNLPPPDGKDTMPCIMPPLSTPYGPPPFLIPLLAPGPSSSQPANMGSNIGSLSAPPIRIFNPEAYCEICNKEFCNKYFLKTHKANKHGVYSMDTLTGSPYANAFLTTNVTAAATLSMRSLLPTTSSTATSSTVMSSDICTVAKISGPLNVEAYCEICQKEFCNKYFLRKHRQKIHGIFDPSITTTGTPTTQAVNGITTSPASTLDSPISNSSSSSVASVTISNHVDSIVSELYSKDFLNRNTSLSLKYTMHNPSVFTSASSLMPSNQLDDEKGLVGQRPYIKPIMGVFTPERLREIGVINADAFCEICCKEFCNKYFLRTHKFSKHGIPLPESSPGKPSGSPGTVPSIDDNSKPSTPKIVMGGNEGSQLAEETTDLTCDVCGRPFASLYLLKMHKFYSHNIPPIDKDDRAINCHLSVKEEIGQDCPENLVKNETSEQQSGEDLRKLQTMIQELNAPTTKERLISCNLCHKEMENKYFLRAHMMNEHGVLHNEESNSGESNTSIKASPCAILMSKDQNFLHRKIPFPNLPSAMDSDTSCDICKKDFGTKYFLHVHKTNMHGLPMDLSMPTAMSDSSSTVQNQRPTPDPMTTPVSSNDRPSAITGRNYCELCNKELCNKYFMKTHMLKMHGINIEDGAGIKGAAIIGGVTCDICQKELCSKYFLKVHKQNTHGIFEESPPGKENSAYNLDRDLGIMPGEITDDNSRYFSHYTEACPVCDRRFKSIKWLKTHMVNDHNDITKENGFASTSSKQQLQHQQQQQGQEVNRTCLVCGKCFSDAINLQVHMITSHYATSQNESGFPELSPIKGPNIIGNPHSVGGNPDACVDTQVEIGRSGNPSSVPCEHVENSSNRPRNAGNGTRIYHCSYCPYSTRWLSNLYAHEKRHTGLVTENEKKFACRLCPRSYRYNHSLQRHMVSHRRAAAAAAAATASAPTTDPASVSAPTQPQPLMTSSLPPSIEENPVITVPVTDSTTTPGANLRVKPRPKKYRCSKCLMKFRSRKFCLAHIYDVHSPRSRAPLMTAFYQKGLRLFKCRKCGFTSRHLNNLKQHIRQQHKDLLTDAKSRQKQIEESNKSEDEAAFANPWPSGSSPSKGNQQSPNSQIPMTYAMPQNPPTVGSFIMQPFLMAQPLEEQMNAELNGGTFVPSLVYLPVCQKVSEPVTIAFTLTPA